MLTIKSLKHLWLGLRLDNVDYDNQLYKSIMQHEHPYWIIHALPAHTCVCMHMYAGMYLYMHVHVCILSNNRFKIYLLNVGTTVSAETTFSNVETTVNVETTIAQHLNFWSNIMSWLPLFRYFICFFSTVRERYSPLFDKSKYAYFSQVCKKRVLGFSTVCVLYSLFPVCTTRLLTSMYPTI